MWGEPRQDRDHLRVLREERRYTGYISGHTLACGKNPGRIETTCEFCEKSFNNDYISRHTLACGKNPGKIETTCEFCEKSFSK